MNQEGELTGSLSQGCTLHVVDGLYPSTPNPACDAAVRCFVVPILNSPFSIIRRSFLHPDRHAAPLVRGDGVEGVASYMRCTAREDLDEKARGAVVGMH